MNPTLNCSNESFPDIDFLKDWGTHKLFGTVAGAGPDPELIASISRDQPKRLQKVALFRAKFAGFDLALQEVERDQRTGSVKIDHLFHHFAERRSWLEIRSKTWDRIST